MRTLIWDKSHHSPQLTPLYLCPGGFSGFSAVWAACLSKSRNPRALKEESRCHEASGFRICWKGEKEACLPMDPGQEPVAGLPRRRELGCSPGARASPGQWGPPAVFRSFGFSQKLNHWCFAGTECFVTADKATLELSLQPGSSMKLHLGGLERISMILT